MKKALGLALLVMSSACAQCTDASCFGPINQDPLTITGNWAVAPATILDFGPRHVILAAGATLDMADCVLYAAKLTAQPGSTILTSTPSPTGGASLALVITAAGVHDGSAHLLGSLALAETQPYHDGTYFSLWATGDVVLQSFDNSGSTQGGNAGWVGIIGASITIGTLVSNTSAPGLFGPLIDLQSSGNVSIGSIQASTPTGTGSQLTITAGTFVLPAGSTIAAGVGAGGGYIAISATSATIDGTLLVGPPEGGFIGVSTTSALTFNGLANADGDPGGFIGLGSSTSDVTIAGQLSARSSSQVQGGAISVSAGRHLTISGLLDTDTDQASTILTPPAITLLAGGNCSVTSTGHVRITDSAGGCSGFGGSISVDACQLSIAAGGSIDSCGSAPIAPPRVSLVARNAVQNDGTIVAGVPQAAGAFWVTSRLAAPYGLTGTGTHPPPVFLADPNFYPCLANFTTTLTTSGTAAPGQSASVSVHSLPNKPLLVVANFAHVHLPLGALGWTQVDVFTGARLADSLGVLGSVIPGTTDAAGNWTIVGQAPLSPPLSGLTAWFDVYVLDPGAANGIFHQPPAQPITLL
jgi:hypothetical protein